MKDYYDRGTNSIAEARLISYVQKLNPNLIVLSICFGLVSKVKIILEKTGLLAERRLHRNLIATTNGKANELDPKQMELINLVADPDNINKNVVILGPEGSGKTLLGIEIVKLIVSKYIDKQNLSPQQSRKDIRVIFSACYNDDQPKQVALWKKQVQSIVERDEMKSLHKVKVVEIRAKKEKTPVAYNSVDNLIPNLIHRHREYKKTVIMIDELNPNFELSNWTIYHHMNCTDAQNVQIVFNLKYDFHDMKIRMTANPDDDRGYEEIGTARKFDDVLVFPLSKAQRCSNQIRNFVYYLLMHEFDDYCHKIKRFDHNEDSFNFEPKPIWIETKDAKSFIKSIPRYSHNGQSLFGNRAAEGETVLIYDPDTIESQVKSFCDNSSWTYVAKTEAVGIEFSRVIIYGLKEFHFEAFTRAVNQLIIVTTSSSW